MKKLLVPFYLTLFIFIGSVGVSESADFKKGWTALQNKDYATAVREWKPLAEQGHSLDQANLGWILYKGIGVSQNHQTALKFHRLILKNDDANKKEKDRATGYIKNSEHELKN